MRVASWVILGTLVSSTARADDATAQALFEDGRAMMERGDFEHACPKLAASFKIDAALGTLLNLALCHERVGRTATAWLEYEDAISLAKAAHDEERLQLASERAELLRQHVPRVTIRVGVQMAGLVVTRDGVDVDPAALGSAVPIDPGDHEVAAHAPGRQSWRTSLHVTAESVELAVDVPELATVPVPRQIVVPPDRRLEYAVGGAGIAAVVTGAVFGLVARSQWNDAQRHCSPDAGSLGCDDIGLSLSHRASVDALVSTLTIGGGLAAIAGAVVMHVRARPSVRTDVAIAPIAVGSGFALECIGRF